MDIQNLLALQEEDGRLRALEHEIAVLLPARRAEAKKRLAAAHEAVETATRENLAAEHEYKRFQRDYTRHNDAMRRAEQKAAAVTSVKGAETAQAEYDAAEARASQAAEDVARADENRTPTERRLDDARAFETEEYAAVQEVYKALDERKAKLVAEKDAIIARCEALAAQVPADQLKYYERLKLTRWPCVVKYNRQDGTCTGCNLMQPPSVTQAVLVADRDPSKGFAVCPSCGRILM